MIFLEQGLNWDWANETELLFSYSCGANNVPNSLSILLSVYENCPVSCIYLPGSNWKSREYIWLYLLIKTIVIFWEAVWMCCYVEAGFLWVFFFLFFKLVRIQDFQMMSAVVLQPLSPWTITLLLFAYYNACWENCWDWDLPKQKASGASRLGRLFNAQLECNRC